MSDGPPASSPAARAPIVVAAAVIERDGCFLLTRRLHGTHLAGRWEFPGGKCEAGESPIECLARELLEELGVGIVAGPLVLSTEHAYEDRVVRLHFYRADLKGEPRPQLGQEMRWAARAELSTLDFPEADAALIDLLTR
ncbi:MAG TPA: (deoxy)nucleoside triphosphate pyrophosphohydrolase [Vicinamibacterales bacterium]|nr:(deoxy)nucleoside triphosphate pyrophosphohydrolase [Vicinamibacterales bacterium]